MGGPGTGHWYRLSKKDTVEGYRRLDVRRWQRDGLLKPGTRFSWGWWRENEQVASITVQTDQDRVTLEYRYRREGEEWQDIKEPVPLTWTPCNYGGARPWFICPGATCGRRVAILYGVGRYFLCRHCYGLGYESQREDRADRLRNKAQAIRRKLGGSANLNAPFPEKPKGMHWKTYWRLRREAQEAEHASFIALAERLNLLTERLEELGR